jgi:hypothetical protein
MGMYHQGTFKNHDPCNLQSNFLSFGLIDNKVNPFFNENTGNTGKGIIIIAAK